MGACRSRRASLGLAIALGLVGSAFDSPRPSVAAEPAPPAEKPAAAAAAVPAPATDNVPAPDANPKKAADLALQRVVLFTSGVGYYELSGRVDGDAQLELRFHTDDVNDLLKSLVLEDTGGGHVSTINYSSRDPIAKTLRSLSIDLTANPTLGDLLHQLRGESVRIELASGPVTGKILGVERRAQASQGKEPLVVDFLNLSTATGLRSVLLESVSEFQLSSEKLNSELQEALTLLAERHNRDKKTVTLHFTGKGQRPVRVGYIQESPIWKTSYRLVLRPEDKALLQGWAIVENTTEHDWRDVRLTLVNGRPISFKMDLYRPLYVDRPTVQPELFAGLRPRLHAQDLAAADDQFRRAGGGPRPGMTTGMGGMRGGAMGGGMGGGVGAGMGGMGGGSFGGSPNGAETAAASPKVYPVQDLVLNIPLDAASGVQTSAQGAPLGELFRYQIEEPASIARQGSAMLPIVNDTIRCEKVSLYNHGTQPRYPLNAVQLVNATSLHLMQGPLTVFDGGEYAGDAQIEDLAPGSRRLVSYALDLDVEVSQSLETPPQTLLSGRLADGVLHLKHLARRNHDYTVKNSGDHAKKVLIEVPIDATWTLKAPEPSEKTGSLYRFAVAAEPGKPAHLRVSEETTADETVALAPLLATKSAALYLEAPEISPAVKAGIRQYLSKQSEVAKLTTKLRGIQSEISGIESQQTRIRQNMNELERNSELYKRYVAKLNAQETQLEKLHPELKQVGAESDKAEAELNQLIADLVVE